MQQIRQGAKIYSPSEFLIFLTFVKSRKRICLFLRGKTCVYKSYKPIFSKNNPQLWFNIIQNIEKMALLALFFLSRTCPNLHMHSPCFNKAEKD